MAPPVHPLQSTSCSPPAFTRLSRSPNLSGLVIDWEEFRGVIQVPVMKMRSGLFLRAIPRSQRSAGALWKPIPLTVLLLLAVLLGNESWSPSLYAQQPEPQREPPEQTIKIEVKEVQIPFSVFDKNGSLGLDLKKEDFRVFEDGIEQEIHFFNAPTNLPLRFGILIDTSSSARVRLKFEKEAAMQLGYYVLTHHADHQGFLMTFDHGPDVLQDYTTNPDDLTTALDGL